MEYIIRNFKKQDAKQIANLFYETIHTVCKKDYNQTQLDVWAPKNKNEEKWINILSNSYTVIIEKQNEIIGFGNINDNGYLDCLYVSKDYQNQGFASKIVNELEKYSIIKNNKTITVDVSITAKPFFIRRGYTVNKEQQVERNGIHLTNFKMIKYFNKSEV